MEERIEVDRIFIFFLNGFPFLAETEPGIKSCKRKQFLMACSEDGDVEKVYVTGCLSERYKSDLASEIPEVDAFFGTRGLPRLLKTLKADYKHELVGFLTSQCRFPH